MATSRRLMPDAWCLMPDSMRRPMDWFMGFLLAISVVIRLLPIKSPDGCHGAYLRLLSRKKIARICSVLFCSVFCPQAVARFRLVRFTVLVGELTDVQINWSLYLSRYACRLSLVASLSVLALVLLDDACQELKMRSTKRRLMKNKNILRPWHHWREASRGSLYISRAASPIRHDALHWEKKLRKENAVWMNHHIIHYYKCVSKWWRIRIRIRIRIRMWLLLWL